jgi:mannose-6-phosphate isomerase-like protein (cupin superfamily)
LSAALKEAAAKATGGAQTTAVSNTDQYRINVVQRTRAGAPLTHAGNTEVHHIIEGAATVVTGGTVVKSSSGAVVEGGVSRRVTKGDVIVVPADTPHWYKDVEGSVTYLEVRFVVPSK